MVCETAYWRADKVDDEELEVKYGIVLEKHMVKMLH
jgi:hypothetical protein